MTTTDRAPADATDRVPARRRGRPPKSQAGDTKAALLDAALTLFARHGFAGTSIRAIARQVGLSESVLYAHFDSKQAIYRAAMATAGPQGAIVVLDALDDTLERTDPAGFLRALADGMFAAWDDRQARQVASILARDGLLHDPLLSDGIDQAVERMAEVFARWIADGRIAAGLGSSEDLAYTLLAPIAHTRLLWLHADSTAEQRDSAYQRMIRHVDLFVAAVLTSGR